MFTPNPSLGFPHFESYRLAQGIKTTCVPITANAQPYVRNGDAFGRKELKARACLGRVDACGEGAVYVDAEGRVVVMTLKREGDGMTVLSESIATLAMPVSSAKGQTMPTVVAASTDVYVASAGDGILSVIKRNGSEPHVEEYTVQDFPTFEVRGVRPLEEDASSWQVVVSRTVRSMEGKMDVSFDVGAVNITSSADTSTGERKLVPVWTLHGAEPVEYVRWNTEAGKWIVGAAEAFTTRLPTHDTADEAVLDQENKDTEEAYTWTQTHDSVTITFDLTFPPSSTDSTRFDPQADVLVLIGADTLTLRFPERDVKEKSPILSPAQKSFLRSTTAGRDWWDQVRAGRGQSAWTFEWIDGGRGKLVVRLEKENEGVRWASVFAPQDGEQVDELLSEAQVKEAAERMARWDVPEGGSDKEQEGLRTAVVDDEVEDDDFDDDPAFSGAVGDASSGAHAGTRWVLTKVRNGDDLIGPAIAQILSTEFVGCSVIAKSHLDGLVFAPTSDGWNHIATNPALAFVLASKRDTQYVRHIRTARGAVVCAFESTQADGTGGNVYVYWPVEETGERTKNGKSAAKVAKQAVAKFVLAGVGALLGVAEVEVDGQPVVVGLGERAWCLLEGLQDR
ncbi:hypothetical protein NliqN6_2262 [Naganishia liquefaciens]|uniref:NudC domain-containing protein 1 n=1 Tax=Naganishia liquefaciens TaxID=104408 RepID=A0A8H3TSJ7_9TREE|nr:hypothetical protein NliqN6_2262 [Naganishia liquefaciens]